MSKGKIIILQALCFIVKSDTISSHQVYKHYFKKNEEIINRYRLLGTLFQMWVKQGHGSLLFSWACIQSTGIYSFGNFDFFTCKILDCEVAGRPHRLSDISLIKRVVWSLTSLEGRYKFTFISIPSMMQFMFHFNDCNRILFFTLLVNHPIPQETW